MLFWKPSLFTENVKDSWLDHMTSVEEFSKKCFYILEALFAKNVKIFKSQYLLFCLVKELFYSAAF